MRKIKNNKLYVILYMYTQIMISDALWYAWTILSKNKSNKSRKDLLLWIFLDKIYEICQVHVKSQVWLDRVI